MSAELNVKDVGAKTDEILALRGEMSVEVRDVR